MTHKAPVPFTMKVTDDRGVHHVRIHGEIDLAGAPTLRRRLVEIAGSTLDVDLSGVTFLDAAGMSALLDARSAVTRAGHGFRLRGARGIVRRVFALTGLDQLLDDEQPDVRPERLLRAAARGPIRGKDKSRGWNARLGPHFLRDVPTVSDRLLDAVGNAQWFSEGHEPYLVVDTELRIRAVNAAYERATGRPRPTLVGELLFDAFPDNPADPEANGVANLGASLETVFSRGARHWMGVQRYDVPNPLHSRAFVEKVWVPVNSPLMEDGRTVAALHHVEDVTPLFRGAGPLEGDRPVQNLEATARALQQRFPLAPYKAILGALAHANCVVMHVIGSPHVEAAARLASLQLEIRFGHRKATEAN